MERRNREIILFFEENEDAKIINGKVVRLYMNRFTINEEERFEIAGVFDLAKVESKEPEIKRHKISNMSHMTAKWNDYWTVIEDAFGKLDIINWFNTDIHIIMGTSSYIDVLNNRNSLLKLIRLWAQNCCSSISFSLTVLTGQHDGLRTKIEVKEAYEKNHIQDANKILRSDNEIFFRRLQKLQKSIQPISQDLEKFAKELCTNDIYTFYNKDSVLRDARNEYELIAEARILQNWASPLVERLSETPNDTLNNDLDDFFEELYCENDKKGITDTPIERKLVLYKMLGDDFSFMKSDCKRFTVYLK